MYSKWVHSAHTKQITHTPDTGLGFLSVFLYYKLRLVEETLLLFTLVIYYLDFFFSWVRSKRDLFRLLFEHVWIMTFLLTLLVSISISTLL